MTNTLSSFNRGRREDSIGGGGRGAKEGRGGKREERRLLLPLVTEREGGGWREAGGRVEGGGWVERGPCFLCEKQGSKKESIIEPVHNFQLTSTIAQTQSDRRATRHALIWLKYKNAAFASKLAAPASCLSLPSSPSSAPASSRHRQHLRVTGQVRTYPVTAHSP